MADLRLSQLAAYDERLRNQQSQTPDDAALEALSPELTKAMRALRDALSSQSTDSRDTFISTLDKEPLVTDIPAEHSHRPNQPAIPERFELVDELGSGGFGIVYQAYDTWLRREVAIKFLRPELIAHASVRQRFLRESRAAARLSHPHIVRVLEVSESPASIWQVCELVSGAPLSQHIAQGALQVDVAAQLARDLSDAVAHAHVSNVLHRDIKPENILIDRQPGQSLQAATLRLTDFGLARLTDIDVTLLSHTGMLVGTPRYMAPEQLSGQVDQHGPRTDIYAIGIVLYEMLTGRNPFGDVSSLQQRLARLEQPITYVRRLAAHVPRDLATICHKCLENRPDRRYQSATELRDDLDRYLRGDPTLARPLPIHERLWRWSARHRASATILAILLITSGLIFAQTLRNNSIYRWQNSQLSLVNKQLTDQEHEARALADLAEKLREEAIHKQERYADLAWKKGIREAYTAWHERSYPEASELISSLAESHPDATSRIEWRLLKADIQRQIKTLLNLEVSLSEVRAIPNTQNVAVVDINGMVTILNVTSGQVVTQFSPGIPKLHALAISADGRWLACGGSVQADVDLAFPKIFDLASLQLVRQLPGQETTIESLEFSADGQQLAVGCRYSDVKVFSLKTEQVIDIPSNRRNLWLAASPSGNKFAVHEIVNGLSITDTDDSQSEKHLDMSHEIKGAAWLTGGDDLVVAIKLSRQASITTTETPSRKFTLETISSTAEVTSIISTGGLVAASLLTGELLLWQDQPDEKELSVEPIGIWKLSNGPITSLTRQGAWLLAATHDGQLIRVRIPATNHKHPTVDAHNTGGDMYIQTGCQLQWIADGQHLLVNKHNGEIVYVDVARGQKVDVTDDDESEAIYSRSLIPIAINDHQEVLVPPLPLEELGMEHYAMDVATHQQAWAYGRNSHLEIFGNSPAAGMQPSIFQVRQPARDWVDGAKFSHDSSRLAWTGSDAKVHVVSLAGAHQQVDSPKLSGQGLTLAWSRKDDRVAVVGQVPVLEFNPGEGKLTEIIDYGVFAPCLAYNVDDLIVSGHNDGSIRFVNPETREFRILQIHPYEVRSLHFTADDRVGISIDVVANMGLWFADGETIGVLKHDPNGDARRYFARPDVWTDSKSILKVAYNDHDGNLIVDTWRLP